MADVARVREPALDELRLDGGTQLRAEISVFRVQEYADAMRAGSIFPPVTAFFDGEEYWLADGFHRVEAAKLCGLALAVDVRAGSQRDAVLFSAGANAAHGQPRSNADKRNAVLALLNDISEECMAAGHHVCGVDGCWSAWADNEIARQCRVSQPFVSKLRAENASYNGYKMGRKVQRGGTVYTQNTANIGLDLPTKDEQAALDAYPESVAQYAWDVYKAERRADPKRTRSAAWLERICRVTQEARETGYTDVGGEQTPLSGALAWDDAESAKRQQEYRRDYSAKRDAQGNLTPEAKEEWILKEARRIEREKKEARKAELEAKRSTVPEHVPASIAERFNLHHCSVADLHSLVPAESVDWIITDPPYPQEFLPVYSDLAEFAAHALKPGGSLLCMVGQSYLPEVLQRLTEGGLSYHWTVAYLTPGGQAVQVWPRKVNTFWKPVLWLTKGEYAGDWIGDVTKSAVNDNDKVHHHWGQSESGMRDLVERFTLPGDTICDPFLGGGTTAVVSTALNRLFIGADVDPAAVSTTAQRLLEAVE